MRDGQRVKGKWDEGNLVEREEIPKESPPVASSAPAQLVSEIVENAAELVAASPTDEAKQMEKHESPAE